MEHLVVIVIDDDGLKERNNTFRSFFLHEAAKLNKELDIWFFTEFPKDLALIVNADVICWDNDLGGGVECSSILRRMQYEDPGRLVLLQTVRTHIVHSMNTPAAERLVKLLHDDLSLQTRRIPFSYMKEHC